MKLIARIADMKKNIFAQMIALHLAVIICTCCSTARAEELKPLKFSSIVFDLPRTTADAFSLGFSKNSLPVWAGILASTAVLYHYDEELLREGQLLGRRWGLDNNDKTKTILEVGSINLVRLPTDTGSALYFLGDGWLHGGIAAGFLAKGYCSNSTRPTNSGIQLAHGLVISTLFSQALKRAFGRQSPNQSTEPRGAWRPFPSIKTYNSQTADFDAMPSGHVMTATLTFTIIRGNYPEYDDVLLPLELTWLTALGFGMVQNGVHWASDYPLGIGMGYVFGKAALNMGSDKETSSKNSDSMFFPGVENRTLTANWLKNF